MPMPSYSTRRQPAPMPMSRRPSDRTWHRWTSCPMVAWTSASARAGDEVEYDGIGMTFDPVPIRSERLAEAVTVLKGLFADNP